MQITEIHVASIPIGLDKDVSDTMEQVFRDWRKTDHGRIITNLAHEIFCVLEDSTTDPGMLVNIFAHLPTDDAVAYKLMKTGIDDESPRSG